jgi:hypothetical protein
MRRTILLALVAALLVVPNAFAAGTTTEILRDCADDGILQGDYTASQLRTARDHVPAELQEYSDCKDVLSREIAAKTASSSNDNNNGNSGGAGGGANSNSNGGGGTTTTAPAATPTPANPEASTPKGRDPGVVTGPSSPQDWQAINGAMDHGKDPVPINGRPISPAAHIGRNGLPGTVIAVLALLAAAAVAATVPFVRRRVVTHRPA